MLISTENTEDFWAKLLSLPSWERGLKHLYKKPIVNGKTSLPSWERGLKPESHALLSKAFPVAPLVGAWIETAGSKGFPTLSGVAPLVERGLKHCT